MFWLNTPFFLNIFPIYFFIYFSFVFPLNHKFEPPNLGIHTHSFFTRNTLTIASCCIYVKRLGVVKLFLKIHIKIAPPGISFVDASYSIQSHLVWGDENEMKIIILKQILNYERKCNICRKLLGYHCLAQLTWKRK